MRPILIGWLLLSACVLGIVRLETAGNHGGARSLASLTGLLACYWIWRLYRLGWEETSFDAVSQDTRRNARRLMWALTILGICGSAWEIFRAYQRTLG